jgi:site-specific DNA-methyltransferase (adenine-specific)
MALEPLPKCVSKIRCPFSAKFSNSHSYSANGGFLLKEARIHPTQKPIALYEWLLENFAEKGQRILDTHLGSGSSAIAAHYFGVDFVGCELDKDYFDAAKARFDMATKQLAMSI